jgi:lysophospholipase L1-like esterase
MISRRVALTGAVASIGLPYAVQAQTTSTISANGNPRGLPLLTAIQTLAEISRYNNPQVNSAMSFPPTFSVSTSAPSYTNYYAYTAATHSVFDMGGATVAQVGTSGLFVGTPFISRIETVADAANITFFLFELAAGTHYRAIIDGQYVSFTPLAAGVSNAYVYVTLAFGTRKPRRVILECSPALNSGYTGTCLAGAYVGSTEGLYKPSGNRLKLFVEGDSVSVGLNATTYGQSYVPILGDLLGIPSVYDNAVSSTGYVANNSGSATNFIGRIANMQGYNPDLVLVSGGFDDAVTPSVLQTAVTTYLQAIRANSVTAKTPVLVAGVWSLNTGPSSYQTAAEVAVSTAVQNLADPITLFIPMSTDISGAWMTGTGNDSSPTGTGNSDAYTSGALAPHPNNAGHLFLAERFADRITNILGQH